MRSCELRSAPAESANSAVTPSVFVVDDDLSVRQSLEGLMRSAGWHVETFSCGHEFLARPRVGTASCLVLDLALPQLSGLDLQRMVADRAEMPVIFISGRLDIASTVRAMKAGAVEFLTKPFANELLLNAVKEALDRSQRALLQEAELRVLDQYYAALTSRERQVLTLIFAGKLNKQVACELGISEITVKAHRGKLMRKMRASSLADLVKKAMRLGLGSNPTRHYQT